MLVVLVQFVVRLATGLAFAMCCLSPREVDSGFFRVHMWVMLGLFTLASLAGVSSPAVNSLNENASASNALGGPTADTSNADPNRANRSSRSVATPQGTTFRTTLLITAAAVSYLGGVFWLYERQKGGRLAAWVILLCGLAASTLLFPQSVRGDSVSLALRAVDSISAAGILGGSVTAMLLGHWYLNSPGMKLAPLFLLIRFLLLAVLVRAIVVGWGTWKWSYINPTLDWQDIVFLGLRWIAGLAGVAITGWLARQTLLIPNTQSATGILYVSVILAFLGELTSQLLSVGLPIPL